MFGNERSLRHLPFFEEVAAHDERRPQCRAATAGLVTLRLVDTWIEEGPDVVAPDSWNVVSVLKAIDRMDAGSTIPSILRSIVVAMQNAGPGKTQEVLPRLMAYARALEYDAHWPLALDAYDTVIQHAHPIDDGDIATTAHRRRGVSLRTLGRFDEALEAYSTSGTIADSRGDMVGVLGAKIGAAIVAMSRGNLPHADRALEQVAQEASELGLPDSRAVALDTRAAVAGFRGDYELAIQFAYEALRATGDSTERDRILNNIGTAFHMLGIRSAARDAFLVLSVTAQEQYTRWAATLSLMTLAAEDGSEPAFEQIRGSISIGSMPPDIKVDYFIHLGRAHRALRHEDLADIAFAKAVELAERHRLSRHLFEAESELKAGRIRRASATGREPTGVLADVAGAIRNLRVQTMAGVG